MTDLSVTQELLNLQKLVSGSRIEYGSGSDVPYITVDGKRQVCAIGKHNGYDLWVPSPSPYISKIIIDDMTCNDFGVTISQAVVFLQGGSMSEIRGMKKETKQQRHGKFFSNLQHQSCVKLKKNTESRNDCNQHRN